MREAVIEAYTQMRHDLACSEVLRLPAGSMHEQRSHLVLLKGTLKTAALQTFSNGSGQSCAGLHHCKSTKPSFVNLKVADSLN